MVQVPIGSITRSVNKPLLSTGPCQTLHRLLYPTFTIDLPYEVSNVLLADIIVYIEMVYIEMDIRNSGVMELTAPGLGMQHEQTGSPSCTLESADGFSS